MFDFIKKRPLWFSLLMALLLTVLILFVFVKSLGLITKHGRSMNVPDVTGKDMKEAEKILAKSNFETEVIDSVYIDTLPPLAVVRQVPEGEEMIKIDRTVYLTINRAVPPEIEMPNLVGYSYRSAELQLKNMGLRIGDTSYKPDFAKNSVLEQSISPGTRIRMGNSVSLILGDGVGNIEYPVPALLGLTYLQARQYLIQQGINLNIIEARGVTDTLNAFIYQQRPETADDEGRRSRIRQGQMVDIWLQQDRPVMDTSSNNLSNL